MTKTYEVDLTTYLYGGEVLGRLPDGRAVFVPFSLPGERVRIRLIEEKRNYARAELLEVLAPAPERIEPLCLHFGVCGGCHYQHIDYDHQLAAKAEIVRDQMERIGRMENPPVGTTVPCPEPYYYRNHVQFHQTPDGNLGYIKFYEDEVLAIQECHLPEPTLNEVWPQLDFEPLPDLDRIGLRLGREDDVQLTLESESLEAPELSVEEVDLSVVHLSPAGPLVLAGSPAITMEVKGRPFRVSAGSFFQVNTFMAEQMVDYLLENLELNPEMSVLELYCGAGLFAAFLAPRVGRLIGVESSPYAAEDFAFNLDEFDNVELYEAPAELALPHLYLQPDLIVLDPPRAGVDKEALDAIAASGAQQIVYISCDPATLARDARRLERGGYRLEKVTPFDLFPQTYHIETISLWRKS